MKTLGIISAMPEEVQCLLDELQNPQITEKGMRSYYEGVLFGKKTVIAFSRWGKVAAAITTTQMINDYNVGEILFTGVCGGLDNSQNIGDIVIGNHLYQHDMDATPLFQKHEIPLLGKTFFEASKNLKLENAVAEFSKNVTDYIAQEDLKTFQICDIKATKGTIISGDTFVSSQETLNKLKQEIPEALAVEMEGAAVAQVCYEYAVPFSIIRTVSDKANDDAHIDFPKFTKLIASKYAKGILKNYCI